MRQKCDEMLGNFAALQEQSHPLADRSVRCTDEPGVSSKQKSLANFATGGGLMFYDYCASSHTGEALAVRHLSAELSIRGRGSISRAVPICIIERVCSIHAVNNHQTGELGSTHRSKPNAVAARQRDPAGWLGQGGAAPLCGLPNCPQVAATY
jgi:hypothetical protein